MTTHQQWVDAMTARVGCRGLGSWFRQLAAVMGLEPAALMPIPARHGHVLDLSDSGLRLTMDHPHASDVEEGDPDRWVMTDVVFLQNWSGPWPFGLNPLTATPAMAQASLGPDTTGLTPKELAQGDLRQTFFLPDGRAIGITWRTGLVGIESIHLARLGLPMDYEEQRLQQAD